MMTTWRKDFDHAHRQLGEEAAETARLMQALQDKDAAVADAQVELEQGD